MSVNKFPVGKRFLLSRKVYKPGKCLKKVPVNICQFVNLGHNKANECCSTKFKNDFGHSSTDCPVGLWGPLVKIVL